MLFLYYTTTDMSADEHINKHSVFTNMELSLKYTSVYGFDFDYTLVQYTQNVLTLIYDLAKKRMVQELLVSRHAC